MAIKSICKTNVTTIKKGATLKEASYLMQKNHVGSLVVTDSFNGQKIPIGIITDRDIALSLGSSTKSQKLIVENLMLNQIIAVKTSTGIFETVKLMQENGVKRLPVIDEDGVLFGIVSSDDLLNLFGEEISRLSKITKAQVKKEQGVRVPSEKHIQL